MNAHYPTGRLNARSSDARVRPALVWGLTLACVALLLPFILLNPSRAPIADAWLEFAGPEPSPFIFQEAPPLLVRLELSLPWPLEEIETDGLALVRDVAPAAPDPRSAYRHFQPFAPLDLPLKSFTTPRHFQYKIDPSFGFENRQLQLNGMMIRVWIDF